MKKIILTVFSVLSVFALGTAASAAGANNAASNIAGGAAGAVEGVVEGAGEVVGGAVSGVGTAVEGVAEGASEAVGRTQSKDDLPNDTTTERGVLGATDEIATNPSTGVGLADMMTVISALGLAGVAASVKKRK